MSDGNNIHGITNYGEIINDLENERDAALARAEAAEAEAKQLSRSMRELLDENYDLRYYAQAAEDKLGDLRNSALLALGIDANADARGDTVITTSIRAWSRIMDAQACELARLREGGGWRPVTDDEPVPGEPHVIATIRGMDLVRRDPDTRNIWHTVYGQRYYVDYEIRGWLKLPLMPDAMPDDVRAKLETTR